MGQAIDALDNLMREELPSMIHDAEPAIAPIFEKIKRTAFGVKTDEGLGRSYKVTHLYETGVAGLMESADPLGPDMTTISGTMVNLLAEGTAQSKLATFPSAEEVPHTGDIKRQLTLHKIVGNYSIPVAWRQADMLNATQIRKAVRDLKAVAKLKAEYEVSSFFSYSAPNNSGYVNQVVTRIAAIAENSTSADYIDITVDEEYGRINNIRDGQRFDIVADNGSGTLENGISVTGADVRNYEHSTQNYVHLIVTAVDYLGKKFTLRPVDSVDGGLPNLRLTVGSGTTGDIFQDNQEAVAGDWIVYAKTTRYTSGSRPQYSWGINDWVKGSGEILGGSSGDAALDLNMYPQFKSQVVPVNGPLSDIVLNNYIGGYMDAYPGESLDTIITTQGVQLQWLQQPTLHNNRNNYDRTGKALDFKGGWTKIQYEFGGKLYDWIISPHCLKKTLYGCKFAGDNIKRYSPPRIGGTDSTMGPELEFLAPTTGHTGVFMGSFNKDGRPQELLQAPFWYYQLIAPIDPRGLKFTGLTEADMG